MGNKRGKKVKKKSKKHYSEIGKKGADKKKSSAYARTARLEKRTNGSNETDPEKRLVEGGALRCPCCSKLDLTAAKSRRLVADQGKDGSYSCLAMYESRREDSGDDSRKKYGIDRRAVFPFYVGDVAEDGTKAVMVCDACCTLASQLATLTPSVLLADVEDRVSSALPLVGAWDLTAVSDTVCRLSLDGELAYTVPHMASLPVVTETVRSVWVDVTTNMLWYSWTMAPGDTVYGPCKSVETLAEVMIVLTRLYLTTGLPPMHVQRASLACDKAVGSEKTSGCELIKRSLAAKFCNACLARTKRITRKETAMARREAKDPLTHLLLDKAWSVRNGNILYTELTSSLEVFPKLDDALEFLKSHKGRTVAVRTGRDASKLRMAHFRVNVHRIPGTISFLNAQLQLMSQPAQGWRWKNGV